MVCFEHGDSGIGRHGSLHTAMVFPTLAGCTPRRDGGGQEAGILPQWQEPKGDHQPRLEDFGVLPHLLLWGRKGLNLWKREGEGKQLLLLPRHKWRPTVVGDLKMFNKYFHYLEVLNTILEQDIMPTLFKGFHEKGTKCSPKSGVSDKWSIGVNSSF